MGYHQAQLSRQHLSAPLKIRCEAMNTVSSSNDKTLVRDQVKRLRRSLPLSYQRSKSQAIAHTLIRHIRSKSVSTIAGYLPYRGEVDLIPLLNRARRLGKTVLLPKVNTDSNTLSFAPWVPHNPLIANRYGILEPVGTHMCLSQIDTFLVPLVAFDEQCNRLGMGGGFYDKALEKVKAHYKPTSIIGIGYDFQRFPSIQPEPWDVSMDIVVTPSKTYGADATSKAALQAFR